MISRNIMRMASMQARRSAMMMGFRPQSFMTPMAAMPQRGYFMELGNSISENTNNFLVLASD
jgi:hypothetical protein